MLSVILAIIVTLSASRFLQRPVSSILYRAGLARTNWKGCFVAPSGGIVIILSSIVGYSFLVVAHKSSTLDYRFILGILLSAYVGLIDDVAGRNSGKGFAGHFVSSLKSSAISTGVVKALFVSLAAVIVSDGISGPTWVTVLRASGIALTANLHNLLDLRPGRCIKAFMVISLLVGTLAGFDLFRFGPIVAGTLAIFPADLRQHTMLGDGGSNLLGFAVGAQIAYAAPLWFLPIWVVTGLGLNLASEKYSFTSIIESNRLLRWFDLIGRS